MLRIYKHYNFVLNDKRYGKGKGRGGEGSEGGVVMFVIRTYMECLLQNVDEDHCNRQPGLC